MRQIRRYSNRKLYDTKESRYVTLEQLADIVRAGETIEVREARKGATNRDTETGADITSKTLAQIVFTVLGDKLSTRGLADVIRRGNKGFSVERFKDDEVPLAEAPSASSRSAFGGKS